MKTTAALILAALVASSALGGEVITNYFPGYVYAPSSFTNAGDTGLSTNDSYLCFPLSGFSNAVSATQADDATGDVRAVVYAFAQRFYESRSAMTNSDRSATTIARGVAYSASGTNVAETVTHVIKTLRVFSNPIIE
jgi:hypothetical protein